MTGLNAYIVTLLIFGGVVLLTAWLPMELGRVPLSLPICCIVIGMLLACRHSPRFHSSIH